MNLDTLVLTAGDAAEDALDPTVKALQESAFDLLDRMIAVGPPGGEVTELEMAIARLLTEHDAAYDRMTGAPEGRMPTPAERHDPETRYHWHAAEACEVVLDGLRDARRLPIVVIEPEARR